MKSRKTWSSAYSESRNQGKWRWKYQKREDIKRNSTLPITISKKFYRQWEYQITPANREVKGIVP
jgi:hypothetical protein